jgi:hypothetical protein
MTSELRGEQMEVKSWPNELEMRAFKESHSSLESASFRKFGGLLCVCHGGNHRNKLRPHAKTTVVVQLVPKLSCLVSAFVCSAVVNSISFHCGLDDGDAHELAASLHFRLAQSAFNAHFWLARLLAPACPQPRFHLMPLRTTAAVIGP